MAQRSSSVKQNNQTTINTISKSASFKSTAGTNKTGTSSARSGKQQDTINMEKPISPEVKQQASSTANQHGRRPVGRPLGKVGGKLQMRTKAASLERPVQHHSFLSDVTDVRKMEQGLLTLLDDFHSGKLQAFGQDCSFEKMEAIREQQEKLARLHFDLGTQQESYSPHSEEGRTVAKENLTTLMDNLQKLCLSIDELHTGNFIVHSDT